MAGSNVAATDYGIDNQSWNLVLSILYFLLVLPSLLLNGVVAMICSLMKSSSSFKVYLKNLVMADFIMLVTLPIRAASKLPGASIGLLAFVCRYSDVFFYLAMNMSTILMGLISLDRFLKIVMPGKRFFCQNLLFSKVLSAVIWMVLIGSTTVPIIITTDQDPTNVNTTNNHKELCINMKSILGQSFHTGVTDLTEVIFWMMLILIVFCYVCITKKVLESSQNSHSRNNQSNTKTKARVFLIFAIFFICFVPYHSVRIPYTNLQVENIENRYMDTLRMVKDLTLWLVSTNICLDPLIYFFLCKELRQKIKLFLNNFVKSFVKT